MSTSRGTVCVVQQLALDGSTSVLEIHGEGGRARANIHRCTSAQEIAAAVQAARQLSKAEVMMTVEGDCERPCPKCGRTGDAEAMFGYRIMAGRRRRRQSWCRRCRGAQSPCHGRQPVTDGAR